MLRGVLGSAFHTLSDSVGSRWLIYYLPYSSSGKRSYLHGPDGPTGFYKMPKLPGLQPSFLRDPFWGLGLFFSRFLGFGLFFYYFGLGLLVVLRVLYVGLRCACGPISRLSPSSGCSFLCFLLSFPWCLGVVFIGLDLLFFLLAGCIFPWGFWACFFVFWGVSGAMAPVEFC